MECDSTNNPITLKKNAIPITILSLFKENKIWREGIPSHNSLKQKNGKGEEVYMEGGATPPPQTPYQQPLSFQVIELES